MLNTRFGIEIEMTGVTRCKAAQIIADTVGGTKHYIGTYYDTYGATMPDGRIWKAMSDGSLKTERKVNGRKIAANKDYSVEVVSPILSYSNDMETLQNIIRALRKAGAFVNETMGIHIHLDGTGHTARSIKNFINIIASKNDLLYDALAIKPDRQKWCKKVDEHLISEIKRKRPQTLEQIENIWYAGTNQENRTAHYNPTRYCLCNLHSFFNGHGTVELRGFNSTLHAGEIRSYVVLALALNHQALTQKSASSKRTQTENPKFAFRTFLVRLGLNGKEFANCREHLTKHLTGNSAWRYGKD